MQSQDRDNSLSTTLPLSMRCRIFRRRFGLLSNFFDLLSIIVVVGSTSTSPDYQMHENLKLSKIHCISVALLFFCVQCLADIAHTLLKIAPYDPGTMKSVGLKRSAFTYCFNDIGLCDNICVSL